MIDIKTLTKEEIDDLRKQINTYDEIDQYNKNVDSIIENRKYIGKCFYNKNKREYLKVLSSKSSNEYRFECLTFSYPIQCKQKVKFSKTRFNGDCFSNIVNELLEIKAYPLLCNVNIIDPSCSGKVIDNLVPISNKQFEESLRQYIEDLLDAIDKGDFDTSQSVIHR